MKLNKVLFSTLLVGIFSTNVFALESANVAPIDLTADVTQTENYWKIKKRSYPKYPVHAVKNNITGCVGFSFVIDDGKARDIQITKSVPDGVFNQPALKSLKEYRWKPSKTNSDGTAVITSLQLEFSDTPRQTNKACLRS